MNRRAATFPFLLEMVDLAQMDFEAFLSRNALAPTQLRIITGTKFSQKIGRELARRVRGLPVEVIARADNATTFHEKLCRDVPQTDSPILVVGVGGGAVLDLAKFHATKIGQPYLAIPTVISNDGVASPIAILKDETGKVESHSTEPPIGILIDQSILKNAPSWALTNGLGEVLSNHAAVLDWDLAIRRGRAEPNALARMMSRSAVQNVMAPVSQLQNAAFLERYINAIVLSGLAMYISGNSRPCSGAEHLIAHVISKDNPGRFGHGYLVGSIAPFIVWLHNKDDRSLIPLSAALRLPLDFSRLAGPRRSFDSLLDEARIIRGPRYTILNEYSNLQLQSAYVTYLQQLTAQKSNARRPQRQDWILGYSKNV